jgi:hypothetical protein
VRATETSLFPSLRLIFFDRCRINSKGWDMVDQVLKKDKTIKKVKSKPKRL